MDIALLLEMLHRLHPDVDFTAHERLVDDGVLDSFDIVTLVAEINAEYDVSIPPVEIAPQNFNSAEALFGLIRRLADD